jgi:hypothetical protein
VEHESACTADAFTAVLSEVPGRFEHMSEPVLSDGVRDELPAVQALGFVVDRLLAEDPVELDGTTALERASVLLVSQERLRAATLAAIRDVDRRELYALDACGTTRSWLRTQLGGDQGQLELARRLGKRPKVAAALGAGDLSGRAAGQLCGALEKVPTEVAEPVMVAVVTDGLPDLLRAHLGADEDGEPPSDAALAVRADLASVQASALAASAVAPAARLEPCLLLLARHLPPGELHAATERLLDALLPEQIPVPDDADFFLLLTRVLDGAWDLRGLLDPETGELLARELERREAALKKAEKDSAAAEAGGDGQPAPADGPIGQEAWLNLFTRTITDHDPHASRPHWPPTAGRRRHDALLQLLRDAAEHDAGAGKPVATALTIVCTLEALDGRLGALPGTLQTSGLPITLRPETIRRLGCDSELTAVLLDAAGRPVGASGTHRNATKRERAALRARWGPTCAIAGCTRTVTTPHHVVPWWIAKQTVLKDLIPICTPDHRDLHEDHRTLRLKDGRLIDELGWVTVPLRELAE